MKNYIFNRRIAMIRYILTAAILAAGQAHAGEVEETCGGISELAETVGEMRYSGVPMRDMMEAVEGVDLGTAIVRDVYNLPDYASDEYQRRAIRNYSNDVYSQCYERFADQR